MKKGKSSGRSSFLAACAAGLAAGIIIKLFIFDVIRVSGTSMMPSVRENSYIIVLKCAYGIPYPFGSSLLVQWKQPQNGDIVLFIQDTKPVIKRCAAVPGTSLEYLYDDRYYAVYGTSKVPLTESQYRGMAQYETVPEGTIFTLGDNYETSVDSREYGFIPIEKVLGKVICR